MRLASVRLSSGFRREFTHYATALMTVAVWAAIAPAATLELHVNDPVGHPLPFRGLVRGSDGGCATPVGAVVLPIGPDRWFFSDGRARLEVEPGQLLVRIERGTEYRRIKERVAVPAGGVIRSMTLERWIDMHDRGYLCGENHLHLDTHQLAPMLVAEGLDFGTSLSWWRGPDPLRPAPAGPRHVRLLRYAGRAVPSSVFDAELEYAWGAAYLQALPRPMPLAAEKKRPNLAYLRHTVDQGGLVHYQSGWSREVAVDALLGLVHTVNVCNNNFHMHRFQPRSRYSNLLDVEGFPIYPDTEVGMMRMNTDTYYRLLNWGLQLAAGAGSATGVKQVPAGYNRTYVRLPPDATLDDFNRAWAAGQNFVTNGPALFLETAAGRRPGDTLELSRQGGHVEVTATAVADQPLTAVEIVVNGRVVHAADLTDKYHASARAGIDIRRGSWIAARCTVRDDWLTDDELAPYANGDKQHPSRLRFAHTSPIYVRVGGQLAAERVSVDEGLHLIDRFEAFTRKRAGSAYRLEIQQAIDTARTRLIARRGAE